MLPCCFFCFSSLAVLLKSKYSLISSGSIAPWIFPHSSALLTKLFKGLATNGCLALREPVLIDSAMELKVKDINKDGVLPERTLHSLLSELTVSGFVKIEPSSPMAFPRTDIEKWVRNGAWASSLDPTELINLLDGNVFWVDIKVCLLFIIVLGVFAFL